MVGKILQNATSVFLGILITIVSLWLIGFILHYFYKDKYFSKEDQQRYKNDIKEYMNTTLTTTDTTLNQ